MATSKSSHKSMPDKNDAIALLKADHRQVEEAFEKFNKARDVERRQETCHADLQRAEGPHDDRRGNLLSCVSRGDE